MEAKTNYNNECNTHIPQMKSTGSIRRNWKEPTGVETPGHDGFNAIEAIPEQGKEKVLKPE